MRLWGNKHIVPEITITLGVNDQLEITVNSVAKIVTIPAGIYIGSHNSFSSKIIAPLNAAINTAGVQATAILGGIHDDNPRTVLIVDSITASETISLGGSAFATLIGSIFKTEG